VLQQLVVNAHASPCNFHEETCSFDPVSAELNLCCICAQAQELQQVLASISGAEQELQALQEQREQLQPAAKEAAELRSTVAQLQDEVRPCPAATCASADSAWPTGVVPSSCNMVML
jgi:hypothetical protein